MHSLQVTEDLVGDAVVLAHAQLLKLAFAVALAISAHCQTVDTSIVLGEPACARCEAARLNVLQWIHKLFALVDVRSVVLREVLEERWTVGKAHGTESRSAP